MRRRGAPQRRAPVLRQARGEQPPDGPGRRRYYVMLCYMLLHNVILSYIT